MENLIENVTDFMTAISPFYDNICQPCTQERIEYYHKKIQQHTHNKNKLILDLGCCTGETALGLAKLNYRIDGVDLSKGMVDISNLKKRDNLHLDFFVADMRCIFNQKRYDTIYCNCLEWLNTYEDLKNMLYSTTQMLKNDGILILDLPNADVFLQNCSKFSASSTKCKEQIFYKLTRFNEIIGQTIYASQTYIHVNKIIHQLETYSCDLIWRLHTLNEISDILNHLQFQIIETTHGYEHSNSKNDIFIQIIAKKYGYA